jgi:hypothetical protein
VAEIVNDSTSLYVQYCTGQGIFILSQPGEVPGILRGHDHANLGGDEMISIQPKRHPTATSDHHYMIED